MNVAIALTTFNGAAHLQAQLDSYLSQKKQPDELVVCDDVSTDETVAILKEFRKTAPFQVRIFINEINMGFTKNFEQALSNCTGDLIFLSDQDDVWFPEKIQVVYEAFINNPDKFLIVHDGDLVDEDLVSHDATKRGQVIAGFGSYGFLTTGALTVVRRDLLKYVLPIPNEIMGHDVWLHCVARSLGKRLEISNNLQKIRRHSQNTSAWIASSIKPINRLDVARNQFLTTPSKSYGDRLVYNSNLIERLNALKSANLESFSASSIAIGLEQLEAERQAILNREELIQCGFFRRKIGAVRMLARGEYAFFMGAKSFMRDMFR